MSPPACAVPDGHERYSGETRFPLIFQNLHRYAFYAAGETFAPMFAGTIITIISIPIYWQLHQHFGVIGLAWASNLAILLQTGTLAVMAHRRHLVPIFGPPGGPYAGLDRPDITRAAIAAAVSLVGAPCPFTPSPNPKPTAATSSPSHRRQPGPS
jgi:peptidoglycan biosynthesis protein MviN/MurJ (putative lipid II flippase)